nr:hypothetical protein 1 [Deltaproteobacteria bacterium]
MAYSYVEYTGDGLTVDFTFSFDYLDQSNVHVYVDDIEVYNWYLSNQGVVRFNAAPDAGTTIKIRRITQRSSRLVDYEDGGQFREKDLDKDSKQTFFITQEALDDLANVQVGNIASFTTDQISEGVSNTYFSNKTVDDLPDGATFQRVNTAALDASGLVLLAQAQGNLDDISNGTNFSRVSSAALDASGLVLLAQASGDTDDITPGVNNKFLTQDNWDSFWAGETLDELPDGVSFKRVTSAALDASGLVLLDQTLDGTYAKVLATQISAGQILLGAASGTLDDIDDGVTYGRIPITSLSSGKILVAGLASEAVDRMFTDAVTQGNIEGWIHASDATAIDGSKIYTGSVTASQIAAGTITATELDVGCIEADQIVANAITTGKINDLAVDTTKLASGSTMDVGLDVATPTLTNTFSSWADSGVSVTVDVQGDQAVYVEYGATMNSSGDGSADGGIRLVEDSTVLDSDTGTGDPTDLDVTGRFLRTPATGNRTYKLEYKKNASTFTASEWYVSVFSVKK